MIADHEERASQMAEIFAAREAGGSCGGGRRSLRDGAAAELGRRDAVIAAQAAALADKDAVIAGKDAALVDTLVEKDAVLANIIAEKDTVLADTIAAKDEVIRALIAERDAAILLAQRMSAANATEPADSQASLEQAAKARPEISSPKLAARRVLAEAEVLETVTVTGGGTTACVSQPCLLDGSRKNGGACVAGEGLTFHCGCVDVFFGARCEEEPPCQEETCQNGGVCSDFTTDKTIKKPKAGGAGGFYCRCQAGWEGTTCGGEVDECASAPCLNRGVSPTPATWTVLRHGRGELGPCVGVASGLPRLDRRQPGGGG